MKKWELKAKVNELQLIITRLRGENRGLVTQAGNLKERVNRHNERNEKLEKELIVLRNDRDCIQESLDEFGSDTVEVIELSLEDRLTEEEMTIYREGMKVINKGCDPVWDNTDLHPDPCFTRQDIENIMLDVLRRVCIR